MTYRKRDPLNPALLQMYRALSEAERSVLIKGAKDPGTHMVAVKGSDCDRYLKALSDVYWAEPVAITFHAPDGLDLVAYKVTDLGALAIPRIMRKVVDEEIYAMVS
ncbi:MAG: hypothetical protein AAGE89_05040 [Pseudomonadota bacterium]